LTFILPLFIIQSSQFVRRSKTLSSGILQAIILAGAVAATAVAAPQNSIGTSLKSARLYAAPPRVEVVKGVASGRAVTEVYVNGAPIVALFSNQIAAAQAAQIIALRLISVSRNGLLPSQIATAPMPDGSYAVTIDNRVLATVTKTEATAQGNTPEVIANSWTSALQKQILTAPITSSVSSMIVPTNETRTFEIGGSTDPHQIIVTDDNPDVATVSFDPASHTTNVQGLAPGRTVVTLSTGQNGPSLSIPVDVKPYAAVIDADANVYVTGNPSTPQPIVQEALIAGLAQAVRTEAGATLKYTSAPPSVNDLQAGKSCDVTVGLKATGSGMIGVRGTTTLHLQNVAQLMAPASMLYFSNNPESVKAPGDLFSGELPYGKAIRLDYHHQNIGDNPLVFRTEITNRSIDAATVQIIAGICLPGTDTIQVGRRAGAAFLNALNGNAGLLVTIPPGGNVPIIEQRFAPQYTVSGILQMLRVGGAARGVEVDVKCVADSGSPIAINQLVASVTSVGALITGQAMPAADHKTLLDSGENIYGPPIVAKDIHFKVGDPWTFVPIGTDAPLKNLIADGELLGNYGVDYAFNVSLANPTPNPTNITLSFVPRAGRAAGVFQLDSDPIMELDPVNPPTEVVIARFPLAANSTKNFTLRTMPLNGSFYPAALVLHVK
jgi:hypothetical protein